MNNITTEQQKHLVVILDDLIATIEKMQKNYADDIFLNRNIREARDWKNYLLEHLDKEEVLSLQEEVADRYFEEYSCLVDHSETDVKRAQLMETFMDEAWKFISM